MCNYLEALKFIFPGITHRDLKAAIDSANGIGLEKKAESKERRIKRRLFKKFQKHGIPGFDPEESTTDEN